MSEHDKSVLNSISNMGSNIKNDLSSFKDGRWGFMSNPVGHLSMMYILGAATFIFGTIFMGAVASEINDE